MCQAHRAPRPIIISPDGRDKRRLRRQKAPASRSLLHPDANVFGKRPAQELGQPIDLRPERCRREMSNMISSAWRWLKTSRKLFGSSSSSRCRLRLIDVLDRCCRSLFASRRQESLGWPCERVLAPQIWLADSQHHLELWVRRLARNFSPRSPQTRIRTRPTGPAVFDARNKSGDT